MEKNVLSPSKSSAATTATRWPTSSLSSTVDFWDGPTSGLCLLLPSPPARSLTLTDTLERPDLSPPSLALMSIS